MNNEGRISDERLFIRYAEGDVSAFRILMERYAVRLLRYCRGFVSSEEEAEDLVQETFLRAIRSAGTYRATSRFSTWIYTIARNLGRDMIRMERTRSRLWREREAQIAESTIGAEQELHDDGERMPAEVIDRALRRLTPLEAETIQLTFRDHMTTAQIANVQGCSTTTVRVRRFQALEKLRERLRQDGVSGEFREEGIKQDE